MTSKRSSNIVLSESSDSSIDDGTTTLIEKGNEFGNDSETDEQMSPEQAKLAKFQIFTYCANYVALGLAVGSLGPMLLELRENTNTDLDQIASLFLGRGIGWIVGALSAGKAFDTWKGHRILWICLVMISIFMFIAPFVTNIWVLFTLEILMGIFMSCVEVGVNTLTVWVAKKKVGPYMQLLHFAFGAGLAVAPFIVALIYIIFPNNTGEEILVSFWVLGSLVLVNAILPLKFASPAIEKDVESFHDTIRGKSAELNEKESLLQDTTGELPVPNLDKEVYVFKLTSSRVIRIHKKKMKFYIVIGLTSFYLFLYGGAETSFGGWIFTYAREIYDISNHECAYLTSAFWGSLTLGRLLSVPLASKIQSKFLLVVDMAGVLVNFLILISFAEMKSRILLWICTTLIGAFMASIFATAFSLPADFNFRINSVASSSFIVSSSIGDMILPAIVGWLFSIVGDQSLMWVIAVAFLLLMANYAIIVVYGTFTAPKKPQEAFEMSSLEITDSSEETSSVNIS